MVKAFKGVAKEPKAEPGTKQSHVIAMLQSPAGATIAAMMKATGWQQHSVRGFLAGVVRKRLKLKLRSKKVDGERTYRITGGDREKSSSRRAWNRRHCGLEFLRQGRDGPAADSDDK
jgi:hypothetical protein